MFPPWSLLLRLFEWIGRIRFPTFRGRSGVTVGKPDTPDVLGGMGWKEYTTAEELFEVWGPVSGSVWEPFHCVTLFAALERIPSDRLGPVSEDALAVRVRRHAPAPDWASAETWAIIDLPGPLSVAAAGWLCNSGGFQPVCTFDNWPHVRGLVHPEKTLAALLRHAAFMKQARASLTPSSPPLWVCDRERLGSRAGKPKEFDNRYFLDDSVLPGPALLKSAGIEQVVYLVERPDEAEREDLSAYFSLLRKEGFPLLRAAVAEERLLREPEPFEPTMPTFKAHGFFRSSAGGFGRVVPEPSSSSG